MYNLISKIVYSVAHAINYGANQLVSYLLIAVINVMLGYYCIRVKLSQDDESRAIYNCRITLLTTIKQALKKFYYPAFHRTAIRILLHIRVAGTGSESLDE